MAANGAANFREIDPSHVYVPADSPDGDGDFVNET